jgi:hypothetical protein
MFPSFRRFPLSSVHSICSIYIALYPAAFLLYLVFYYVVPTWCPLVLSSKIVVELARARSLSDAASHARSIHRFIATQRFDTQHTYVSEHGDQRWGDGGGQGGAVSVTIARRSQWDFHLSPHPIARNSLRHLCRYAVSVADFVRSVRHPSAHLLVSPLSSSPSSWSIPVHLLALLVPRPPSCPSCRIRVWLSSR